ncbi:MAG: 50S ribosomal protein L18 [Chloroflexota bacterium]
MARITTTRAARQQRHRRIRQHLAGTPERPRLAIFRSTRYIYAQVIDDAAGHTLAAASTKDLPAAASPKTEAAKAVGKLVAERAKAAGVSKVVFDRGGFRFHGRVKAVAEGAREEGLEF